MKPGMMELLVVLLIVVVIFGPTQIPKLTKMIGKSIKNLRAGMSDDEDDGKAKEKVEEPAEKKDSAEK